jgi:8-oxo-dGTP pyrophosphatase MutT (NUDIX family)
MALTNIARRICPHLQNPFSAISVSGNRNALTRTAAVLIIIHLENDIPHILLTRRSSKLRYHTGEISFPGGQYSQGEDQSLLDSALRETW